MTARSLPSCPIQPTFRRRFSSASFLRCRRRPRACLCPTWTYPTTARRSRSSAAARAAAASATPGWSRARCGRGPWRRCWRPSRRFCLRPASRRLACCRSRRPTTLTSSDWCGRSSSGLAINIFPYHCRRCGPIAFRWNWRRRWGRVGTRALPSRRRRPRSGCARRSTSPSPPSRCSTWRARCSRAAGARSSCIS